MKYGFVFPSGDARTASQLAHEAESAGWDGFFVWEPVWGVDAWVTLTAAAMRTERIRLGTMISPLSRMRPWKLASESATLDRLSGGRVILSVGLGAVETGFEAFGEETDRATRAELLDEGLEILTGLWRGQPFNFSGKHYQVQETTFNPPPPPVQQPRIPIWVVGAWHYPRSMRRALRYDGILPMVLKPKAQQAPRESVKDIARFIRANRIEEGPFDIVVEGTTPADRDAARKQVSAWQEAGATWWIESLWEADDSAEGLRSLRRRIAAGPPA